MTATIERSRPVLAPQFCKGCGRCIDSCAHHCIHPGTEVNPSSGFVPVVLDLEHCTACGLCLDACPEPYGLSAGIDRTLHEARPAPAAIADARAPLPDSGPLVVKGMYASALGAILAGCRHFFGYPITPSTEGSELMAKLLPRLDGAFVQAVSEVASINMVYGAAAAGVRAMTFTSSPGFSLMLEGISYMIGARLPGVVVNVMRGGPGLGNIGPGQSDIKLACRGLGHGDTRAIVLAPATPQEMLDLTALAFDLSFAYRNPVIVLADGYLGQMTGKVRLPGELVRPGVPAWCTAGDAAHRNSVITSIFLNESELEEVNRGILATYRRITDAEQRCETFACADAEVLVIACNTPARMAKGAVTTLRGHGVKAGLFRPVTLWPFPIRELSALLETARHVVIIEASDGQLEDEVRLAMSRAGVKAPPISRVNHYGGVLPSHDEIVDCVRASV